MKIEVNTLSGQTRTLEAEKSDTVASVVEKIDAEDWKDPEKRVLSFNGKELDNDKTLEDQGITEDSTLKEGAAAEAKASAAEAKASADSDGAADDGAPTDDENRTVSQKEPKVAAEQSQTSAESNGGYSKQMDCQVAAKLAAERGLPADLAAGEVRGFLEPYGYDAEDDKTWGSGSRPKLTISLHQHKEFGDTTQYEVVCVVEPEGDKKPVKWATLRRLKHLREGLHDPIKVSLGDHDYKEYFGQTPFAHKGGPPGTSKRLSAWFESLAHAVNAGVLSPMTVSKIARVLDGPGTPLFIGSSENGQTFVKKDIHAALPITSAVFGERNWTFDKN